MKIGLPLDGKNLSSHIASNFERCAFFGIYNSDLKHDITIIINDAQTVARGAEDQVVNLLIEQNIGILITPNIDSIALNLLLKAGVRVYLAIEGTFRENIDAFQQGRLIETFVAFPTPKGKLNVDMIPISTFQNNKKQKRSLNMNYI